MKRFINIFTLFVLLTGPLMAAPPAVAFPLASYALSSGYQQPGSGWLYDLTVKNESSAGYDLYWLAIDLPQDYLFTWLQLPGGWTGYPDQTFTAPVNYATLFADFGYELPGGGDNSIIFSFTIDSQLPGNLQYTPYFTEPQTVPVPEPSVWLLMVVGLGSFVLLRRRAAVQ